LSLESVFNRHLKVHPAQ